jgi:hypothetical protein
MKHLMLYENYTTQQRVDDLLDKISKYGMKSLSKLEVEFLDAHKTGGEEEIHNQITKEESEKVFKDDDGYFTFTLDSIEDYGDETHYIGKIECPDYTYGDETIPGILEGRIVVTSEGLTSPDFCYENTGLEIFDFCEGLEYELDSFIDYVVSELESQN